jgi:hypothetical protein
VVRPAVLTEDEKKDKLTAIGDPLIADGTLYLVINGSGDTADTGLFAIPAASLDDAPARPCGSRHCSRWPVRSARARLRRYG